MEGTLRQSPGLSHPSRQLPPATGAQLLVGFQPGHREQAVEDFEFVALGKLGEFGRRGADQDQGVIRVAVPGCRVVRRSPPAGRLALPAAPCAAQKAYSDSHPLYKERYAVSGRNSRTYFSTLGIGTPQLQPSLQYLAI